METLGACYFTLQNNDEAIKWYKAALKYNPNSEIAKKGLRRLSAD
jgi:tetratricopeptide (TPR) repeat protein